jgi:hypothetical protein
MLGSSVLLLNALGAAIGSFVFGWATRAAEADILFTLIAVTSTVFAAFIAFQPRGLTAVAIDEQSSFVAATSATAPAALQQDPRAGDIAKEDQLPPADFTDSSDAPSPQPAYTTTA